MAERFGLRSVRVVVEHFHQIVAEDLGGADLALDLITPTSASGQHLDFSTPYLTDTPLMIETSTRPSRWNRSTRRLQLSFSGSSSTSGVR